MRSIPDQINPVIRPLMEALRKERNIDLQVSVKDHIFTNLTSVPQILIKFKFA